MRSLYFFKHLILLFYLELIKQCNLSSTHSKSVKSKINIFALKLSLSLTVYYIRFINYYNLDGTTTTLKHHRHQYSCLYSAPATMEDLLAKIQAVLASNSIEDEAVLSNIIKSLFYGLWNFDKMINQHNLSTRISQLLLKMPKKNAVVFFKQFLGYLD